MDLEPFLNEIGTRHGIRLTLGEKYAGGEQGAIAITDDNGTALVLKWSADPTLADRFHHARSATDVLRRVGYPAPDYRYGGVIGQASYSIHEAVPGQPLGMVTADALPRLLELNRLQRDLSPLPGDDWYDWLVNSVTVGCGSYCLPETLEAHSPETRTLLARIQRHASPTPDTTPRTNDIVHLDFNPGNILINDGAISGVIDWDGVRGGDCSFDLVTLLFYTRDADVRQAIWPELATASSPKLIGLGLGHLTIRQLDWTIRHHEPHIVDFWLTRCTTILDEYDAAMR